MQGEHLDSKERNKKEPPKRITLKRKIQQDDTDGTNKKSSESSEPLVKIGRREEDKEVKPWNKTKHRTEPTCQGTVTLTNEEESLGDEDEIMSSYSSGKDRNKVNEDDLLGERDEEMYA